MKKVVIGVVLAMMGMKAMAQDATVAAPSTDQSVDASATATTDNTVVEVDPSQDPNATPADPAVPAVSTLTPPVLSTDPAAATESSQTQALQQAETTATSLSTQGQGN